MNILLIVYNRADKLRRQIELLKTEKIKSIYIASDGINSAREHDIELVEEVQDLLKEWGGADRRVKLSHSNKNMGLKKRMTSAIDWIASETDRFIVLEDDCLPNSSFLDFAESGLDAYVDDPSVTAICGFNRYPGDCPIKGAQCFLSCWHSCWGWATWSHKWRSYRNLTIPSVLVRLMLRMLNLKNYKFTIYYMIGVFLSLSGLRQSWAYLWSCYNYAYEFTALYPTVNLITNCGQGGDATNTVKINKLPYTEMMTISNKAITSAEVWEGYSHLAVSYFVNRKSND